MRVRPGIAMVSTLVLVLVGGLVVLLVDRGPDPDAPGYTSSEWHRETYTWQASRTSDRTAYGCLQVESIGRLRALVRWAGSETDAEVELRDPQLRFVRTNVSVDPGCEDSTAPGDAPPPARDGITAINLFLTLSGRGPTCDWDPVGGAWRLNENQITPCEDSTEAFAVRNGRYDIPEGEAPEAAWSFGANRALARWDGSAAARAGSDSAAPFDSSVCLTLDVTPELVASPEPDLTEAYSNGPVRLAPCVNLWEVTPWGSRAPDDR